MIPFLFNENRFYFVAEHLLVGHLCTNPKSDEKLLSCLKVTQCSTNEIRDGPLYNSWLYRSKLWQQDYCQHPQNKNLDCHEYHLKHLYSCFSSHFCFLVFLDFLFVLALLLLFVGAEISLSLLILIFCLRTSIYTNVDAGKYSSFYVF